MFLIGARILSGSVSAEQAGEVFAAARRRSAPRAARTGCKRILPPRTAASAARETAILALGRLGAREMTASSDLDLIVIYDFDQEHPQSDGPRPLYGAQYFARLTQRLISALTVPTNYGVLYPVDMRLRPSGRSGPLATQIDGFPELSGTRGLDLGAHGADPRAGRLGPPAFAARVEAVIRDVLCREPRCCRDRRRRCRNARRRSPRRRATPIRGT